MKSKLIYLQNRVFAMLKTIEYCRTDPQERKNVGLNQLEVEIENINNEILELLRNMKDE